MGSPLSVLIPGNRWKHGQPSFQVDAAAGRSVSTDLGAAAAPEERKQVDWGGQGGEKAACPITNAEGLKL